MFEMSQILEFLRYISLRVYTNLEAYTIQGSKQEVTQVVYLCKNG